MRAPERIAAKEADMTRSIESLAQAKYELMCGEHLSGPQMIARAISDERGRCLAWVKIYAWKHDVAQMVTAIEKGEPSP